MAPATVLQYEAQICSAENAHTHVEGKSGRVGEERGGLRAVVLRENRRSFVLPG